METEKASYCCGQLGLNLIEDLQRNYAEFALDLCAWDQGCGMLTHWLPSPRGQELLQESYLPVTSRSASAPGGLGQKGKHTWCCEGELSGKSWLPRQLLCTKEPREYARGAERCPTH
jgi:hypothetical protein